MDLIRQHGSALGPNIVMVVGYNEFADEWADSVDTTLDAFERIGVERVFWLTMIGHHPYLKMNDELRAAAEKHPKLTVVDWYAHSRNHPDWFQDDGLHLGGVGAQAMARLIRRKLLDARRRGAAGCREDGDAAGRAARKVLHALGSRRSRGVARTHGRSPDGSRWDSTCVHPASSGECAARAARPVRVHRPGEGRDRPDRHSQARASPSLERRQRALPDRHLRDLLPDRSAAVVGVDAAPAGVAGLDPARELRLLRVVGLAVRPLARRLDGRQPRARRRDPPARSRVRARKALLAVAVAFDLGLLGYFKYAGFFVSSAENTLSSLGLGGCVLDRRT